MEHRSYNTYLNIMMIYNYFSYMRTHLNIMITENYFFEYEQENMPFMVSYNQCFKFSKNYTVSISDQCLQNFKHISLILI
jgi:hypothetical protein